MQFIELTGVPNCYVEEQTFHIRVDHILYVTNYEDHSIVRVGTENLNVVGTPEEVIRRIMDSERKETFDQREILRRLVEVYGNEEGVIRFQSGEIPKCHFTQR